VSAAVLKANVEKDGDDPASATFVYHYSGIALK
jgi:hypothetical protein